MTFRYVTGVLTLNFGSRPKKIILCLEILFFVPIKTQTNIPIAHGDQDTRQLAVMQGQLADVLVQALSTPRGSSINHNQTQH